MTTSIKRIINLKDIFCYIIFILMYPYYQSLLGIWVFHTSLSSAFIQKQFLTYFQNNFGTFDAFRLSKQFLCRIPQQLQIYIDIMKALSTWDFLGILKITLNILTLRNLGQYTANFDKIIRIIANIIEI